MLLEAEMDGHMEGMCCWRQRGWSYGGHVLLEAERMVIWRACVVGGGDGWSYGRHVFLLLFYRKDNLNRHH